MKVQVILKCQNSNKY